MRFRINILKRFIAIIAIVLATAGQFAVYAQPNFVSAKYITPDQQTLEVEFDEVLSWTTAGTWAIKIGGTTVVGVLGPGGSGTNILVFALPAVIDFSDVQAGITVEYADDGDVNGPSGQLLAFGPSAAVNDVIIDCNMLTGVQGISVDALSGPCAPVSVTISFFWEWSRQARNSINWSSPHTASRVFWNDPADTRQSIALSESIVGSGTYKGSASFTYPADGTECVYELLAFPFIRSNGSQPNLFCIGGSSQMNQALTNWNTDALATGELQINPDLYEVCLGQDANLILSDVTLFNCRKSIEPNKPNIGPRYVQFVYGTLGGKQIPNVYVNGIQVTDAAGNLVSGVYVDPTIHFYDSADVPFPNALTLPVTHTGDLTTDNVGDQFEITIRNWGPCNLYFGGVGTPVETTAIIEIVDGPIADAGPDQTICEGSSAALSGSISNTATTATWTTAGDGAFSGGVLDPDYSPGTNDISNGSVWLILTSDAIGGCLPYVDSMLLTIDPAATVATTGSDASVCGTSYPDLGGNAPSAVEGETGLWTVVSGNGIFTNATNPNSGVNNLNSGANVFQWEITRGLCTSSEIIIITAHQAVNAGSIGNSQTVCATVDNPGVLTNLASASGGDGSNYAYQWEFSITGSGGPFADIAGATASTYNPGPLTQTTWYRRRASSGVCSDAYSNVVTIIVEQQVSPGSIGADQSLCAPGDPVQLNEIMIATGGQAPLTYQWKRSNSTGGPYANEPGTGINYNPAGGLVVNSYYYVREVSSWGVCPSVFTNEVTVVVNPGPPITPTIAGPSNVCEDDNSVTFTCNAVVGGDSYFWTVPPAANISSGQGTTSITVDFTGVPSGVENVSVIASNGCGNSLVANYPITIEPKALVNAGSDEETCENTSIDLSAISTLPTVSNFASLLWTSSGTGSFDNANIIQPVYTPGIGETGNITLTVTVVGNGSCPNVSDNLMLSVTPLPIANTGGNDEVCTDQATFTVSGASSGNGIVIWTTSGDGTFVSNSVDNPTYNLGATDKTSGSVILTMTVSSPGSCSDAASNLTLTISPLPTANAGGNDEVCTDQVTYTVSGASSGNGIVIWTTSGDGAFVNNSVDNPTYNLGATDKTSGSVVLTMTVASPGSCSDAVSNMTLTITPLPIANAGGNDEVCEDQPSFTVSGASHTNGLVVWTTSGDGGFVNANIDNPIYNLGATDITNGSAILTMTISSPGSCVDAVDNITLTITPVPTADAGGNAEVCVDQNTFSIAGASHTNGVILWTTSGDGSFSNTSIENPVYTLGATDKTNGNVTLTMTVSSPGSCSSDVDFMTLTITPLPIANSGGNGEVCEDQNNYLISGASHANGSVAWTSSGTGSFNNNTFDNPTYTLSAADKIAGSVTLTMTVSSAGSCSDDVSIMTLLITPLPTAYAGLDGEVCVDQASYLVVGATATNGLINWTTSGDGNFVDASAMNPVYNLGANDRTNGSVVLNIIVTSPGTCGPALDNMTLVITPEPTANAGLDDEICASELTYTVSGASFTNGAVIWTTSGDGNFDDVTATNPVYNIGATDRTNASVTLTMTTHSTGSCPAESDDMVLALTASPITPPIAGGGATEMCVGASGEYYSVPFNAGNSYVWNIPAGPVVILGGGPGDNYVLLNYPISGTFVISVTEYTPAPASCPGPTQQITANVYDPPIPDAGPDVTICEGSSEILGGSPNGVGASASGGSGNFSFLWAPSFGLDDASAEHPNASPIATTTYTLMVTDNLSGCTTVQDQVVVNVIPLPVVDAGTNEETCENMPFDLATSGVIPSVSNFSSVTWTTSGTGSFSDPNILTPVYNPGAGEIGAVTLTLTATGNAPCGVQSDNMLLTITPAPLANAGSDEETCEGSAFDLSLSVTKPTASNYTSVSWVHNGTGSFNNPNILTPTYMPGVGETGVITLTMTVTGNGSCTTAIDDMQITIVDGPLADAGSNAEICENEPFNLASLATPPTASNYVSVLWTHNGTGSFADPNILVPVYNPGLGETGIVTLTMTVTGNAPCLISTDHMALTIDPKPVLDPNLDKTVCSDNNSGIILNVAAGSVAAVSFNINAITVAPGLIGGGASAGPGQPSIAIRDDIFTNTTANPLTVQYDIIPVSANGCEGLLVTVTLTVDPEPVLDPALDNTVCSGDINDITLATNGTSVVAAVYDITSIRVAAGLNASVGNASPGNGKPIDAIENDVFVNLTSNFLTVEYDIVPVSAAGCYGDLVTVILTVNPEPVLAPGLNNSVCSDQPSSIVLATNGTSVNAAGYNIVAIREEVGLVAAGGNATTGNGQGINAIANDVFNNTTSSTLTVEYDVVPVSVANCEGQMETIVLTVSPKPVMLPGLDDTVCSGNPSGIIFNTNGTSVSASNYNISDIRVPAGLTPIGSNAAVGNGQLSNAIANDLFTNVTAGALSVQYDVVPVSAAGCLGDLVTISLTVDPEPVLDPNLDNAVCSDLPSAINFATNGISVGAASYNIVAIRKDFSLVAGGGNAGVGNGQLADAIASDIFTNTTIGSLTVEYDIVPVSAASCEGDLVTVTLTVDPKPVLDPNLNASVCSDLSSGIILITNGISVAASNYNITEIRIPVGLTPAIGNEPVGNGRPSNAISGDIFTNLTSASITVEYDIVPVSGIGCLGDLVTIMLVVEPEPVLDPVLDATVCSGLPSGITFNTNGTSIGAAFYNIMDIRVPGGLSPASGNATAGNGKSPNAISGDIFTNTSAVSFSVEYDVVPVSPGGCLGEMETITLTVDPEPVLDPNMNETVCSDLPSGITLVTNGISVVALNFNIVNIRTAAGLNPLGVVALPGAGQASNAIANDIFENTTSGSLTVEYDVIPVSAGSCEGDMLTIVLTIDPKPVLEPMLDATVCSDNPSGIVLKTNGTSIAAGSYNIMDIRVTAGLGVTAGNANIGNGQSENALAADVFTNPTSAPLTVEYDVIPVSGIACLGDLQTITLTVNPEPVLDPNLDKTVCSDNPSGITLNTDGVSIAASTYNILAIRASAGLAAAGGNAIVGNNQLSDAIVGDIFTNPTNLSLTVEYDIVPVEAGGCEGDMRTITLTIDPGPVLDPDLDETVCSNEVSGIALNTIPTSVVAATYTILDIRVPLGLTGAGNATPGAGQPATAIQNDVFENLSAGSLNVEYDIVPVSAINCEGDMVTVVLTVNPQPILDPALDATVCSDLPSGISLNTIPTSVPAASYNIINIRKDAGLTDSGINSVPSIGQAPNAIAGDAFTNITAGSLNVEYDIVPVSADGCLGDMVTIILTIDPEPVLDPNLNANICSDLPSGITLLTNGVSVAADHFTIADIRTGFGLQAAAGNATKGQNKPADAIIADVFTNTTSNVLQVQYDIIPISGDGCEGDQLTITLTVDPEPVMAPNLNTSACSDLPIGVNFVTNGVSVLAVNYNILDIRWDVGLTPGANAAIGNGQPANAIANDTYNNPTNGLLKVEYDVVPVSAASCEGKMVTITVTIEPEPVLDPGLDLAVCSDQPSGITLTTIPTSIPASYYNIIGIRVNPGLTAFAGNATVGNGKNSAVIFNDRFENVNAGPITVEYDVLPVSAGSCEGDMLTITLTVDPKPVMDPDLDEGVCSGLLSGIVLNTNGSSVAALTFTIVDIRKDFNLVASAGNATTGSGFDINAIVNDVFTNNTASSLTVEYDIIPISAGTCVGDMETVVLTVEPEPVMDPNLNKETCSRTPSGILLKTNGASIAAVAYDIVDIRPDAALVPVLGNSVIGPGQADNAIMGDIFANTTSGSLNVEYDVVPVSAGGCQGDLITITLTVNPEPVLDPTISAASCSNAASGITLSVIAGSVAAASFDVALNLKDPALSGSPTTGTGLPSNAIASDVFRNTTGGPLNVVYDVTPISADGCRGEAVTVTLIVNPEPILASNLNATTCSESASGIVFDVAAGSEPALTYNLISINVPSGLTPGAGNATIGTGMAADTISGDIFTNLTSNPQIVIYDVVPVSADGCEGDLRQVMLTVNPEPILNPNLDATTCSDAAGGIVFEVAGGSVAAANYNIMAINADPGLSAAVGNATTGNGLPATEIAGDIFTNLTNGALQVVYDIVPVSASGCEGDLLQITLTVNPEPILSPDLDATVCSDLSSGIILDVTAGSAGALSYNLVSITPEPGLVATVGNATVGTGKNPAVISNDLFTNRTANPLNVVYGIIPVSVEGCMGDLVLVTLTIDPEPVIDPNLNKVICSNVASGLMLNVTATSVAADHYDISKITVAPGLTADTNNAKVGVGQADNAIAADIFTNITAGPLTVIYEVTPVSGASCEGDLVQITLTVNPEPIFASGLDATVCSRENSGIVFSVAPGSVSALRYNITSIVMDPALVAVPGNATVQDGVNANAILTDKFINTSIAAKTVSYSVAPVSGSGCIGKEVQIVLTINPEPVLDPGLDTPVCSDLPIGVTFVEVPTSVVAVSYTINSINIAAGLIPGGSNSGPGNNQLSDAISNDIFTNFSAGSLDVIYTVVPVSTDGCNGLPVQITVSINPEPTLSSGLNTTVCSDVATGVVLDVSATSVAAANYNLISVLPDPSLTPDPMNIAPANGLDANALANDKFTNTTSFPLTVVYDIVPVSADGCEGDMRQVIITVQPKPILTAGLNETLCSGLSANIALSVTNGVSGVIYNWDAPVTTGGMTGGTSGPSGYITDVFINNTGSPQTATYKVVPMSGMGCVGDTGTVVITVNPNPSADINGGIDPLFTCGGTDLQLDGNPSGGSLNYTSHAWSGQVGSLNNITIQTPVFNTTFTGSYTMIYTVTDDNGCMGTDQVTVIVDSPRALFSMDKNTGCDSYEVNFTNSSIGGVSYAWNFGDGSPVDNTENPGHTFDNATTTIQYFDVKLVTTSANGCVDSVTQVVTVYPTVLASFTITPDTICHGDAPVTLAAEPGGSAYRWDFGDGSSVIAGNVTTHSFTNLTTNILTRTVTLTTESFYGCSDIATQEIVIYPTPVPEFNANPQSQTWPSNTVQFTNLTNSGNWTYLWNFGDAQTSAEFEPVHSYDQPGTYTIILEVTNGKCSNTVSHSIEILPIMPVASFAEVDPGCSPYTVQFENTSQNATSYVWDFGDGSSSPDENPEHTFFHGGTYAVRLTAFGPAGLDKYQQLITVYQSPIANLDVAPNFVYVDDKAVKCFNLSTYGDSYLWEFGDGHTDTIFEPYHVYSEEGIFDISLTVYTDDGCEDKFTLSPAVTVEPAGVLRYPTAFRPNKTGPTGGEVPSDPNMINTVFFPPIKQQIDNYHLQVFNRWGELLFESTDINIGWDGYYKGRLSQQDVYVWLVVGKYNNGKPYKQAGDITLLH